MKLVETITAQKRELENEIYELKSRMAELINEQGVNLAAAIERPLTGCA